MKIYNGNGMEIWSRIFLLLFRMEQNVYAIEEWAELK